eukprot:jgi/Undpi1/8054/HiC_scaffold_24.g10526.m1
MASSMMDVQGDSMSVGFSAMDPVDSGAGMMRLVKKSGCVGHPVGISDTTKMLGRKEWCRLFFQDEIFLSAPFPLPGLP